MLELANLVLQMTSSKSKIEFHPLPGDDPKMRKPDISSAQKQLAWSPSVELKEGLEITIREFITRL
jgi:UDP-glucuronate decarboxylase